MQLAPAFLSVIDALDAECSRLLNALRPAGPGRAGGRRSGSPLPPDKVASAQSRPVSLAFRATLLADLRAALAASASPAAALQAAREAFASWRSAAVADAVSESLQLAAAAAIPGKFQVSSVKFQGAGPEAGAPLETANLKLETFRNSAPLAAAFFSPDTAAAGRVAAKEAIHASVFKKLLPELRGRAFTVTGLAGLDEIARVRAAIEDFTRGQTTDGGAVTWDDAKGRIVSDLGWDDEEAAQRRAELLLRTHGFQAYQAATWETAQADSDTTHLQYMTMEDDHVRDSHAALDGLVLPKDDPFWDEHYPPWDWGCRCSVRPMNPDLVDATRAQDEGKPPEDRNVIEGPALEQLRQGTLIRGGRRFDVTSPANGPDGRDAFQWHPESLKLPLADVLAKYSPDEAAAWRAWAAKTEIFPGHTVAQWAAQGRATPTPERRPPARPDANTETKAPNQERKVANEPDRADNAPDHAAAVIQRQDSERYFARGKEAFGQLGREWGAALEAKVLRRLEEEWSAQVAAVATGRKPLFHEQIGSGAGAVAAELRKALPAGIEVRATEDALFVWHPGEIARLADPGQPVWDQVQAHANDGRWLGYGGNHFHEPTVLVNILNPDGVAVSGFRAPANDPEPHAARRADDFTLATGRPHTAVIVADRRP